MVALKGSDIEAFVTRPDSKRPIALVFGPDAGLVRERVDAILKKSVDNTDDPFSLARLDGDTLADDPGRLMEEAHTIPLFGGRRAVWVRAGGRNFSAAIEALIANPPSTDCRIVIEAGDLKRNASLRAICEKAACVAALPCYADAERDLFRLIDEELRTEGFAITPEARTFLASLLGGDRRASRSELRKLVLYAYGKERIDVDDVLAVVADASALTFDGLIDAAFAGRIADIEIQFSKARAEGLHPSAIVSSALRHIVKLHRARLAIESGTPISEAMPGLHFRRKPLVESALSIWSSTRLENVMAQFSEASLEIRRRPTLAEAIARRALLSTAILARRRN